MNTWMLIVMLNGFGSAAPAHTIIIPDMPNVTECRRVANEIDQRFAVKKSLCLEIRKTQS